MFFSPVGRGVPTHTGCGTDTRSSSCVQHFDLIRDRIPEKILVTYSTNQGLVTPQDSDLQFTLGLYYNTRHYIVGYNLMLN